MKLRYIVYVYCVVILHHFILFSVSCRRKNRKDGSDRGIDSGDWRAGGEAPSHGGRHARLRRRHQQPRLVRSEEFLNSQTLSNSCVHWLLICRRAVLLLRHVLNVWTEMNFPLPVSTPSSATSTTSLSATSTTRAASIADTSLTTEFTAASTSSPRSATGESHHTEPFSLSHRCLSNALFPEILKSEVCLWPDAPLSPVQPAWSPWMFSSWRPSTTRSTWFPSSPRQTHSPSKRGRGSSAGWGQHSAFV